MNGHEVITHEGGSVLIVTEISPDLLADSGEENRITIAVNNTLDSSTLPQSRTSRFRKPQVGSRFQLERSIYSAVLQVFMAYFP